MAPLELLKHGTADGTEWMAGMDDKQQRTWASFFGFAKKTIMKDKSVAAIDPKIDEFLKASLCANSFTVFGVRPACL
jgi:hypothetical protein